MKYIKTYEKETDEIYKKIMANNDKDFSSPEMRDLLGKQFEIDDKYKQYKYKYLVAEIYYPQLKNKKIELIKCLSVMLNHMHGELYSINVYGEIKGKYNTYAKFSLDVSLTDIDIIQSFDNFKDAEDFYVELNNFNL